MADEHRGGYRRMYFAGTSAPDDDLAAGESPLSKDDSPDRDLVTLRQSVFDRDDLGCDAEDADDRLALRIHERTAAEGGEQQANREASHAGIMDRAMLIG